MLTTQIISAVLQVVVFSAIPFIVYLFRARTAAGFFGYIGLFKTSRRGVLWAILASTLILGGAISVAVISADFRETLLAEKSIIGDLKRMGFGLQTLVLLSVLAWVKTSFAEEILFRGFIAKRLISWLGFSVGNLLQAVIFGLVHLALFALVIKASPAFILLIFLFSGTAGYVIAYINEKVGRGSILPGWIAHGLGNFISYIVIAFLL